MDWVKRVGNYWFAIAIGIPTAVLGAIDFIHHHRESAALWFLGASVALNLSLGLVLRQARRAAKAPPTTNIVINQHFGKGSKPKFTLPGGTAGTEVRPPQSAEPPDETSGGGAS